jgi:glutathione S-transferase
VDIFSLEHRSQVYKKINPTFRVPTLVDDDNKIIDSHSISIYLVEKYALDDFLYPKDLVKRTKVNQMLFFEATILFQRMYDSVAPIYYGKAKEISQEKITSITEAYEMLENFLSHENKYFCGSLMTLADLSIWSTVLSLQHLVPIDGHKFQKLEKWLKLMKTRKSYEFNQNGANQHFGFIKSCMNGKPEIPKSMTIQK